MLAAPCGPWPVDLTLQRSFRIAAIRTQRSIFSIETSVSGHSGYFGALANIRSGEWVVLGHSQQIVIKTDADFGDKLRWRPRQGLARRIARLPVEILVKVAKMRPR